MQLYYKLDTLKNALWIKNQLLDNENISSNFYKLQFIENYSNLVKCGIELKKISQLSNAVTKGTTPTTLGKEYKNSGIMFIRSGNILENQIDYSDVVFIDEETNKLMKRSQIFNGDILLNIVGASIGRASVYNKNSVANTNQAVSIIKISENVDKHYICCCINSKYIQNQVCQIKSGAARDNLDLSDVSNLLIPIPSPEIQKYIGDKVRKAEELREEAKRNENEASKEFDSLFDFKINKNSIWYLNPSNLLDRIDCEYNYNYFFELEKNLSKQGVHVLEFGELIAKKMSEPQTDSSDFVNEGIPVLRITDIHEDYLDFENCAKIPEEIYNELKEFQIIPGDVIFGLSGTVGRAIVVPQEIPKRAITNRRIAKVTLKEPELACYIAMFLNSEYGKMQLLRETTGGVQKNLRLEDITKIHISIPGEEIISKISNYINNRMECLNTSRLLIQQAKQDVEDLIEGNFDMLKIKENN